MKPIQNDKVWQSEALVQKFLSGVRGAIPLAQMQVEVMLRLLSTRSGKLRRFLDLGCGDGLLGSAILEKHPRALGYFVDFSEPMLQACRQKLQGRRAEILQIDYGKPTWTESVRSHGPFDAVVSGFSIHHQPDHRKRALYREIFELLTPGGWFVNIEHVAPSCSTTTRLFDATMIESIHRLHPHLSRATVSRRFVRRVDKEANLLAPVDRQCDWLHAIGFTEVDCYLKVYELAVFGGCRPR